MWGKVTQTLIALILLLTITACGSRSTEDTGQATQIPPPPEPTDYETIGQLVAGETLEITGRNADNSWWQVAVPGGFGWIAASVTTASGVDSNMPVAEAAQPPVQEQPAAQGSEQQPQQDQGLQEAQVVNVVDGDSIDVLIDGREYRVHYI